MVSIVFTLNLPLFSNNVLLIYVLLYIHSVAASIYIIDARQKFRNRSQNKIEKRNMKYNSTASQTNCAASKPDHNNSLQQFQQEQQQQQQKGI